ncbi:hypothetical protein KR054_009380 [Drosophila jambulina]|nr:hypothetical protein KR054_009380 [Drosophila jambulina]
MSFEFNLGISLLLLTGCFTFIQGATFPQCENVDSNTFVMAIDDCASYIYCNGEDSFRDSCPEHTYFDDRTQECAFDDAGVCLRGPETIVTEQEVEEKDPPPSVVSPAASGDTTPSPFTDSPTVSPSSPTVSRPHCESVGDSVHPHPQRCEYYYRCLSGYLTIVRCPYNYLWDFALEQCRPSTETRCLRT